MNVPAVPLTAVPLTSAVGLAPEGTETLPELAEVILPLSSTVIDANVYEPAETPVV